jgi:hypothetical protein
MSTTEVVDQLKYMSNPERLEVIEAASRLIRQELTAQRATDRAEQDRRLSAAALAVKDLYEPGSDLTEWTSLDGEEFLDDYLQR